VRADELRRSGLARTYGGASNPRRIGVESAVCAIEEAAELALRDAGLEPQRDYAVGAGLAGTAKTGNERTHERRATEMFFRVRR